ncbi:MAG: GNAT family N-acetyltransferase [Halobacteriaceae archaeon]
MSASGPDTTPARRRAGPRLRLDWERFAYAGKFVLPETGAAVARERDASAPRVAGPDADPADLPLDDSVLAAAAVSPDRTAPATLRVRYVTVRVDRRGEGLGARLLAFVAARAGERGYERVAIAANNPFAHEAAAKAGFGFTGETTGLAELVCARPAGGPPERVGSSRYADALDRFAARPDADGATAADDSADPPLAPAERAFLAERVGPPDPVAVPPSTDESAPVD